MSFTLTKGTLDLVLPSPDFGNGRIIDPQFLVRNTRSNESQVFKDADWPIQKSRRYAFSNCTYQQKIDARYFFVAFNGLLIDFEDHNADTFQGFITSSVIQFITNRDNCSYSFSIDILIKE